MSYQDTLNSFNTQPPEGGWRPRRACAYWLGVSTHSRPKAAGCASTTAATAILLFQHTAARRRLALSPTAMGYINWFQHTAARRRLEPKRGMTGVMRWFQHTAARRRLGVQRQRHCKVFGVSTHSRPKAAGLVGVAKLFGREFQHTAARRRLAVTVILIVFSYAFQHTAARRRLDDQNC